MRLQTDFTRCRNGATPGRPRASTLSGASSPRFRQAGLLESNNFWGKASGFQTPDLTIFALSATGLSMATAIPHSRSMAKLIHAQSFADGFSHAVLPAMDFGAWSACGRRSVVPERDKSWIFKDKPSKTGGAVIACPLFYRSKSQGSVQRASLSARKPRRPLSVVTAAV